MVIEHHPNDTFLADLVNSFLDIRFAGFTLTDNKDNAVNLVGEVNGFGGHKHGWAVENNEPVFVFTGKLTCELFHF